MRHRRTGKKQRLKRRQRYQVQKIRGGTAKFLAQMGDYSCHYVSNNKTKFLLDSGSTDNMCTEQFAERHGMVIDRSPGGLRTYEQMNGTKVKAIATAWWETRVLGQEMIIEFAVLPTMGGDNAVLAYTWLRDWEVKQDFGTGEIEIGRKQPIGKILSKMAKTMLETSHVKKRKEMEGKTWEEVIPKEYHKYGKAFDRPSDRGELPKSTEFDMKFEMIPGWKRWYANYHPDRFKAEKAEEEETISDHLKRRWIKEIWDPIVSCATVFALKKDGTKRYCQDYRGLNENTQAYPYRSECIDRLLEKMKEYEWYSSFDLKEAYHTVLIDPEHRKYTAFDALGRIFQWNVMLFGPKQAPGIWSAYVKKVFSSLHLREDLRKEFGPIKNPEEWLGVYMDDLIIYTHDMESMIRYNSIILRACEIHGFTVNWKKSELHKKTIKYCGFELSPEGLRIDPDKHKALQEYPRPSSAKTGIKWRATLQFNRKHYADVQRVIDPITKMFKKGVKWESGTEQEEAWQRWMAVVPEILHKFDPTLDLHIETDASNSGWAAVYYQVDHHGEEKSLEFRGGLFNEAERRASASEREFLAKTNAAEDRRYWTLHGRTVMFHMDHKALLAYTNE